MKNSRLILYTVTGALMLISVFGSRFVLSTTAATAILNPLGSANTIQKVLDIVLVSVQYIAGVLSVIFIILAGLKFVMAGGDTKKIETARNMILYVIIGVAILFGAKAISIVVQNTILEVGGGR